MKLPHILCPACSSDAAGSIGDLLESLRINFLAVKKIFFARPFKLFPVQSCGFGKKQSRFFSHQSSLVEIYNEEKILLLEGRYRTSDLNVGNISGGNALSAVKQKRVKSVHSMDVRTYRFVMLYQVMDPGPLVFNLCEIFTEFINDVILLGINYLY